MADLQPGSVFAGYRIEGVAGRGGMGVVYRAVQLTLNRTVAVKVLPADLADAEQFRERFRVESEIAASIDHPNVIPIYDAGEEGGSLYVTMRYVDGTDLRELVARAPLDPRTAAAIVNDAAQALDAAHARGLVHRDVKPGNVLIEDPGGSDHVFLTDFGLTKDVSADPGLTETGNWLGTVDYAAPEQIRAKPVDARADVYALGGVLYWALTGRVPYPRESDLAKMYAHLNEPPPQPPARAATAALRDVIARAMAKDPADRYQSAGQLGRAALVAAADGGAGAPAAASPGGRAEAATRTLPVARGERQARSGRWLAIAGAAAVIAGVALLALAGAFDGGGDGGSKTSGGAAQEDAARTPTTAEVTDLLQTYADRYGAEDAAGLGALLTPDAVRHTAGQAAEDRSQAIADYRRQFAELTNPSYRLSELRQRKRAGAVTVSGRYAIASASGTTTGRVVFDLVKRDGRVAIRRLEIRPAT
jgi:protein kinase-like protein